MSLSLTSIVFSNPYQAAGLSELSIEIKFFCISVS